DGGCDRNGQAFDRQAERLRGDEEDEERRARHEPDRREAEHQAAEVRRRTLRRRQHDPQVFPLVERPVDREDSQREGQSLCVGRKPWTMYVLLRANHAMAMPPAYTAARTTSSTGHAVPRRTASPSAA